MPRQQFDLIVFDWDGTLSDSTAHIAQSIQGACRDLGLTVPPRDAANFVIGLGLKEALQIVAPALQPVDYPRLTERYRFHFLTREPELALFDGVREMLDELRDAGYFLAVATGKSRVGLNRALDKTRLAQMFDATRCADETLSKPNPAMLIELNRELGQAATRTLMIGDTTHDLQMATNAGTAAVAVAYGAHTETLLLGLAPRYCAHSVTDLRGWLAEHA